MDVYVDGKGKGKGVGLGFITGLGSTSCSKTGMGIKVLIRWDKKRVLG